MRRAVEVSTVRGQLRVNIGYDDFVALIRLMLHGIDVNEQWYLRANDDVADALARGAIASAREHFVNDGYLEGRMPFPMRVNEAWYLQQNPDVAEGIRTGGVESAQAHFEDSGYREGRRPFPL
ncbi:MAG: hypothetical protein KGI51_07755 [Rhodospirillales bacterium]|nr:hypothetical protein [Rhodospirillales bacterium]